MSKLKEQAARLREIAADLEAPNASLTPAQAVLRYLPSSCDIRTSVHVSLLALGGSTYDARKCMCGQAGQQLGHHIAEKLEFAMAQYGSSMQRDEHLHAYDDRQRYTANVIVMTPEQLREFARRVIEALAK